MKRTGASCEGIPCTSGPRVRSTRPPVHNQESKGLRDATNVPEGPPRSGRTGGKPADERSVPALTTRRPVASARQAQLQIERCPEARQMHPGSQGQSMCPRGRCLHAPRRDRFGGGRGRTRRPEPGIEKISRWVVFYVHDSFGLIGGSGHNHSTSYSPIVPKNTTRFSISSAVVCARRRSNRLIRSPTVYRC